jgi:DNA repair protein RadC
VAPFCGERSRGIAAELLGKYGSLARVLSTDEGLLAHDIEDNPDAAAHLIAVGRAHVHLAREKVPARTPLKTYHALLAYLQAALGHLRTEQVRVLHLNARNELLGEHIAAQGTVDDAPLYQREVMFRALQAGASGIILVHNHPSGDGEPSRGDIEVTRQLAECGKRLGVALHDHLIIAGETITSFRVRGFLGPA